MKAKRDKLVKRLIEIREEESKIHEQINKMDYDKKSKDAIKYVGSYYQQVEKNPDWVYCIHIYDIRNPDCSFKGLSVHYSNEDMSYFGIEQCHHFKPKDKDSLTKYKKISKETFEKHYKEVQKRIDNILKNKSKK